MSHVPSPATGDLAVHMGYVLKNVEAMTATLADVRANMVTKGDLQTMAEKHEVRAKALEERVSKLEHGRTALIAGACVLALVCGGAGAMLGRLLPAVPPTPVIAKAAP
jgi:hypothetical protein